MSQAHSENSPEANKANNEILVIEGVTKTFGELVAIENASMTIRKGEIHALVGENGAGKSTLMNILYGIHARDSGEIRLRGHNVQFSGPAEAIRAGVGMVHQHFKLSPSFTVAENIILGSEPMKGAGRVDFARAEAETRELSRRFDLELDPQAIVAKLPVGLRQRVEILKALYRSAEILILDEPTAVLTPNETRELFNTMRSLAASGCSIIFISHKLREVLAVSDRISVMRRGRIMRTFDNKNVTAQDIANEMVGRSVLLRVDKSAARDVGKPILEVKNLVAFGDRGERAVDDLSLTVRAGEIVGVAGVQGNGQDELVECIAGLRSPAAGMIAIDEVAASADPRKAREAGLAYIPVDRGGLGLSLESPLWENLTIGHLPAVSNGPFLSQRRAQERAHKLIQTYDVRGGGMFATAGSLSGGNQQKIQIARELSREARLIIAEQPSQGVDIGAIESIHKVLVSMRNAGKAVLVVSADLDEVIALSDRIVVMYRGRIVADLSSDQTSYEEIGRYMGGLHEDAHADTASTGSGTSTQAVQTNDG
ncbi:ABC transporter ATP-binding protein [Rhizobium sp. 16-449-1b]|uniref:ABC transporter ATP-binding protein n=1 Tax=Rhizobium sp. 16-449-1b TaxID=2819989 RepID=UPI001ADA7046|nr:ABC transporter ATP-binding protein [Rhizobium sp. 16-449-1b]MBO9196903.1 ABC transporter ATP-binding protein [Rhizobium sp. 16-449-1b]